VERIGNYRIDGERGRDAAGVTYEARHLVLPRRALIRVPHARESSPSAVQLLREACILEALEHPGVIRVYESGLLLPDRRPWFAHECVEGATVDDMFAAAPLEPAHAAALLRDLAEVLDHAHRRGVIHCGLRPDLVVVTGRARGFPLCIADWADARIHDTSSPAPALTIRDYAAPELIRGDAIDDRADVFALGVIAYQALGGELPFGGAGGGAPRGIDDGTRQHVPTAVRSPDAPPELTGLVDQMLAWDRWDRPSSGEALAELTWLADAIGEPAPRPSGAIRIRRPRWTPSHHLTSPGADAAAVPESPSGDDVSSEGASS
jgi:serine/threonine protein kinase